MQAAILTHRTARLATACFKPFLQTPRNRQNLLIVPPKKRAGVAVLIHSRVEIFLSSATRASEAAGGLLLPAAAATVCEMLFFPKNY